MSDLIIRPSTAEDWPAITRVILTAFHSAATPDFDAVVGAVHEQPRSLVAIDPTSPEPTRDLTPDQPGSGGEVVGHAGTYTRDLAVPGAVLPAAHVSMVAVAPTHRRRGLLTRLMHRQLADAPEPISVLWASEPAIYPRFGYGLASNLASLTIDTRRVRLPAPTGPGRVRLRNPADVQPQLRQVYEAVYAERPGWSSRDQKWWEFVLADPPSQREGATPRQVAMHEGADGLDGYAVWYSRRPPSASDGGELIVHELVTTNPTAYLNLWRFLLSIDLIGTVKHHYSHPQDPLQHLVDDPRQLHPRLTDGLWLRILDLPAALAGRRYAAPVDLVLAVTDPLREGNTGRWRLVGDPEKATCTRVDDPADLECHITDLAAAYLGGSSLTGLAAAGRVHELRPGTLAAASIGFGWHQPPAPVEGF